MEVKVVTKFVEGIELPKYETENSAGMDVRANLDEILCVKPGERVLIKTGLFVEIPQGYEIQIRPRSGLAIKHGISIVNSPGTIDADYRGEIGVILINQGGQDFIINPGDRIAQMVLNRFERIEWEQTQFISETERGEGGFGSTGV